jgi:hypothetical protein
MMRLCAPAKLLGDKGYDSDDIRDYLAARHRAGDPAAIESNNADRI